MLEGEHAHFVDAVSELHAADPQRSADYVKKHAKTACEVICVFPKIMHVLERLSQSAEGHEARLGRLEQQQGEMKQQISDIQRRQAAEGKAIIEIILLISPMMDEQTRRGFDQILTDMEVPLHS